MFSGMVTSRFWSKTLCFSEAGPHSDVGWERKRIFCKIKKRKNVFMKLAINSNWQGNGKSRHRLWLALPWATCFAVNQAGELTRSDGFCRSEIAALLSRARVIAKADSSVSHTLRHNLIINGLVQDCSNSTANALELLQSCTKPSIYCTFLLFPFYLPIKMKCTSALGQNRKHWPCWLFMH